MCLSEIPLISIPFRVQISAVVSSVSKGVRENWELEKKTMHKTNKKTHLNNKNTPTLTPFVFSCHLKQDVFSLFSLNIALEYCIGNCSKLHSSVFLEDSTLV